ncbi:MAG TPA: DnaJ family domain-containing protein [Pyrinomonadaceae bacterium]|nr:DnaJ family domain-containing protein [Pyrinomonadaceae bacterium]
MFDRLAEQRIREGMEAGEFDDLEGRGRPVNLDEYFAAPEELRAGYALLKNAKIIPEGARLLKKAEELRRELEGCRDPLRRRELARAVDETMLKYRLLGERYRRSRGRR